MSIFEMSVTCSFSQELYSHIDKNSGGGGGGGSLRICFSSKYLANKGTSLRPSSYVSVIQANKSHSSLTVEFTHSK